MTPIRVASEALVEALTVAMALAPGVYARNRMFELFAQPGVQRAKMRAAILRGVVPQLVRAQVVTLTRERRAAEPIFILRYQIAAVRLLRVVELSGAELAALRLLAARAGVTSLAPEGGDRAIVDEALARLLELEQTRSSNATRALSPSSRPPPPRSPA